VSGRDELADALREAIAADDGPRLVQVPVATGMWFEEAAPHDRLHAFCAHPGGRRGRTGSLTRPARALWADYKFVSC
jgi:hypothetical protein